MSSAIRVPVCVTLPPELIERVGRIAKADERSRSFVVARALEAFCDQIEIPSPPGLTSSVTGAARSTDAAAGARAPSGQPAAERYPHNLHLAAMQRQADAKRTQAAETAQARDAALNATTDYMTKLGKGDLE